MAEVKCKIKMGIMILLWHLKKKLSITVRN